MKDQRFIEFIMVMAFIILAPSFVIKLAAAIYTAAWFYERRDK